MSGMKSLGWAAPSIARRCKGKAEENGLLPASIEALAVPQAGARSLRFLPTALRVS